MKATTQLFLVGLMATLMLTACPDDPVTAGAYADAGSTTSSNTASGGDDVALPDVYPDSADFNDTTTDAGNTSDTREGSDTSGNISNGADTDVPEDTDQPDTDEPDTTEEPDVPPDGPVFTIRSLGPENEGIEVMMEEDGARFQVVNPWEYQGPLELARFEVCLAGEDAEIPQWAITAELDGDFSFPIDITFGEDRVEWRVEGSTEDSPVGYLSSAPVAMEVGCQEVSLTTPLGEQGLSWGQFFRPHFALLTGNDVEVVYIRHDGREGPPPVSGVMTVFEVQPELLLEARGVSAEEPPRWVPRDADGATIGDFQISAPFNTGADLEFVQFCAYGVYNTEAQIPLELVVDTSMGGIVLQRFDVQTPLVPARNPCHIWRPNGEGPLTLGPEDWLRFRWDLLTIPPQAESVQMRVTIVSAAPGTNVQMRDWQRGGLIRRYSESLPWAEVQFVAPEESPASLVFTDTGFFNRSKSTNFAWEKTWEICSHEGTRNCPLTKVSGTLRSLDPTVVAQVQEVQLQIEWASEVDVDVEIVAWRGNDPPVVEEERRLVEGLNAMTLELEQDLLLTPFEDPTFNVAIYLHPDEDLPEQLPTSSAPPRMAVDVLGVEVIDTQTEDAVPAFYYGPDRPGEEDLNTYPLGDGEIMQGAPLQFAPPEFWMADQVPMEDVTVTVEDTLTPAWDNQVQTPYGDVATCGRLLFAHNSDSETAPAQFFLWVGGRLLEPTQTWGQDLLELELRECYVQPHSEWQTYRVLFNGEAPAEFQLELIEWPAYAAVYDPALRVCTDERVEMVVDREGLPDGTIQNTYLRSQTVLGPRVTVTE